MTYSLVEASVHLHKETPNMGFWEILCLIVAWQKGFIAGILTYIGGYVIATAIVICLIKSNW